MNPVPGVKTETNPIQAISAIGQDKPNITSDIPADEISEFQWSLDSEES